MPGCFSKVARLALQGTRGSGGRPDRCPGDSGPGATEAAGGDPFGEDLHDLVLAVVDEGPQGQCVRHRQGGRVRPQIRKGC